ncbi:putative protein OS=Streptomyces aurantiogriseus OX=66870 GN=GCM10010251_68800 PE=4 SV=1 [Streptomyces aurantiogriseus]|uniref:Uncharacterized protein n=1 Tax=Streptomyces aurantiogriseus TaxID=66870 RepID=A0A918KXU6_9ACTN|nr:hypothetical protein GCM10010251_68800 [Streptomyces aurantiogriseus]
MRSSDAHVSPLRELAAAQERRVAVVLLCVVIALVVKLTQPHTGPFGVVVTWLGKDWTG